MVTNQTGAPRALNTEQPLADQHLVYPPADVARRLGISGAGLRRLAQGYERVFRPLPRDPKHGRLWPEDAILYMEAARAMVGAGKATSVEAALDTLAREDHTDNALGMRHTRYTYEGSPEDSQVDSSSGSMEVLVQVLRALRLNLEKQQQRLASLETDVRVLRAHLPESWPTGDTRLWWRRLLHRR